jgi:hypothetical protein
VAALVLLVTDGGAAQMLRPAFSESPDQSVRQGFSVVLVVGDTQGSDMPDTIPAVARRALADMKDFLPYKSYKLLDTQWTLCCGGGSSSTITRLRGLDDQEYQLEIRGIPSGPGRLQVRFVLREPGDAQAVASSKPLDSERRQVDAEIFQLERELQSLTAARSDFARNVEVGVKDGSQLPRMDADINAVKGRIQTLKAGVSKSMEPKSDGRPVIDTSFQMTTTETVVVGTSRLKGGSRALIALLTAVPAPKKMGKE